MTPGQRVRRIGQGGDHQAGHIVEMEDGGIGVQLDRGTHATAEKVILPYKPERWEAIEDPCLQPMQVAHIAFEADRALRIGLGEYGVADWISMREGARVEFLRNGPPKEAEQRRRLYAAILGALTK